MKDMLYLAVILLLSVTGCQEGFSENTTTHKVLGIAEQGTLDLCLWNKEEFIPLKGKWEFYWQQLLNPEEILHYPPQPTGYISVPSRWQTFILDQKSLPDCGYATYCLRVKNVQPGKLLGILVPRIVSAYKLWIDEQLILENGQVGTASWNSRPADYPQVGFFTPSKKSFTITIQVTNFHDVVAGIYVAPGLGDAQLVLQEVQIRRIIEAFIAGTIFVFAFYHIGLFFLRKKDASPLFFGLFCLLIIMRSLFYGEQLMTVLFPFLPFEVCKKFESMSLFLGAGVYALFFSTQFRWKVHKWLAYGLTGLGSVFTLISFFTPFYFYVSFFYISGILTILSGLYFFINLVIMAVRKTKEISLIFILGQMTLTFSTILEMVLFFFHSIDGFFSTRGLLIFIFVQSILLASKSTRAFWKVEKLTAELQQYSRGLEEKVLARTHELEEMMQQKTQFFINLSHEIKTPLTLITNYFEKYFLHATQSGELEVVKRNLDKLKYDIMNYLDWERLQSNRVYYDHNQYVNLSRLIEEKLLLFRELAAYKQITIHSFLEKELFIQADPFALDRIFNNLLDNAIKYNKQGGKVTITLQNKGEQIEFSIADTGIGIAAEKMDKLFLPFQQLDHPKKNREGIGVGLAIVKEILDDIRVLITVESTPDTGTKFKILFNGSLPSLAIGNEQFKVSRPLNFSTPQRTLTNIPHVTKIYTLLLVEDNEDMLAFLFDELKDDYNIIATHNGVEAIEAIKSQPEIDLIISDVMMDQMDGYEFFNFLRGKEQYNHIPFVFLTVRNVPEEKIRRLGEGAVDYIQKPFDIREVHAKIIALLLFKQKQVQYVLQNVAQTENRIKSWNSLSVQDKHTSQQFKVNCHGFQLSRREKEIIRLLLKGLGYKEIARELNLSVKTIDNHIQRLYHKTAVHNKIDLLNMLTN